VDVAPSEGSRGSRRITEPETPDRSVSQREFDEMVRDLHVDEPRASTATADRAERDPAADADPEDLVLKDDKPKRDKQKRPRNKRHGRSR
jgi:SecD/SecF fusion protein